MNCNNNYIGLTIQHLNKCSNGDKCNKKECTALKTKCKK